MGREFVIPLETLLTLVAEFCDYEMESDIILWQIAHITGGVTDEEIETYIDQMRARPDLYPREYCCRAKEHLINWRNHYAGAGDESHSTGVSTPGFWWAAKHRSTT
jgi:hypothetical protein